MWYLHDSWFDFAIEVRLEGSTSRSIDITDGIRRATQHVLYQLARFAILRHEWSSQPPRIWRRLLAPLEQDLLTEVCVGENRGARMLREDLLNLGAAYRDDRVSFARALDADVIGRHLWEPVSASLWKQARQYRLGILAIDECDLTRSPLACRQLMHLYPWALSGEPAADLPALCEYVTSDVHYLLGLFPPLWKRYDI